MEDEPVQAIRETSRCFLFQNRRKQKNDLTDERRHCLPNLSATQIDISSIANKLKTKSSISLVELKQLQNALVDDPRNIEVMLNTHGALRGLVRELTGSNVSKQCVACNCLCNLALGDSKACCTIAKAAGAYLVAALDSLTTQLSVSCAWTLGNLAGSGKSACRVLEAQGALVKLCDVTHHHAHTQHAPAYGLIHAAFVMNDDLKLEHVYKIVQSLSKMQLDIDSSQLLFMISCHRDFAPDMLPDGYLQRIVEKLADSMERHLNICLRTKDEIGVAVNPNGEPLSSNSTYVNENYRPENAIGKECCELVYLLRALANLNSEKVYSDLSTYFVGNNLVIKIRRLLEINMNKSLLWLLGNMMNFCASSEVFFKELMCF